MGIEQHICNNLRKVLADIPNGERIDDSAAFRDFLSALEYFVPEVLREIHSEWHGEALDGIIPLVARKMNERCAEILGLAWLISDQTLTPIHVGIQIAPESDAVLWCECRLGKRGSRGLIRTPSHAISKLSVQIRELDGQLDQIDWMYHVTFGQKRSHDRQ